MTASMCNALKLYAPKQYRAPIFGWFTIRRVARSLHTRTSGKLMFPCVRFLEPFAHLSSALFRMFPTKHWVTKTSFLPRNLTMCGISVARPGLSSVIAPFTSDCTIASISEIKKRSGTNIFSTYISDKFSFPRMSFFNRIKIFNDLNHRFETFCKKMSCFINNRKIGWTTTILRPVKMPFVTFIGSLTDIIWLFGCGICVRVDIMHCMTPRGVFSMKGHDR